MSRDQEWLQLVPRDRSEEFAVARALFKFFLTSFSCFHSLTKVLAVSLMAVTLQMMSNSHRSSLVINAHLPMDQAGGRHCSITETLK
jgi:hypothetical protein